MKTVIFGVMYMLRKGIKEGVNHVRSYGWLSN